MQRTYGSVSRASKYKHKGLLIGFGIFGILVLCGCFGYNYGKSLIKSKATYMVINQVGKSAGLDEEQVNSITSNLSDEDKTTINSIIDDKLTTDNVSEAIQYVQNDDIDGLKEYAKSQLTDDEINQLKDIYNKYKDDINVDDVKEAISSIDQESVDSIVDSVSDSTDVDLSNIDVNTVTDIISDDVSQEDIEAAKDVYDSLSDEEKQSLIDKYGYLLQ